MFISSDSTEWDVVWFEVLLLFVLEENFPFFEGKTTLVEVDAVEGA